MFNPSTSNISLGTFSYILSVQSEVPESRIKERYTGGLTMNEMCSAQKIKSAPISANRTPMHQKANSYRLNLKTITMEERIWCE